MYFTCSLSALPLPTTDCFTFLGESITHAVFLHAKFEFGLAHSHLDRDDGDVDQEAKEVLTSRHTPLLRSERRLALTPGSMLCPRLAR